MTSSKSEEFEDAVLYQETKIIVVLSNSKACDQHNYYGNTVPIRGRLFETYRAQSPAEPMANFRNVGIRDLDGTLSR